MAKIKNKTHLKNRIIQLLRKLTWSWQPIADAENEAKVDAALFECNICGKYVYKGKSKKNLKKLQEKYYDKVVEMGVLYKDHINPVIPVGKQTKDLTFDEIIGNMFCEKDNIQCLCKSCHDEKTAQEKAKR